MAPAFVPPVIFITSFFFGYSGSRLPGKCAGRAPDAAHRFADRCSGLEILFPLAYFYPASDRCRFACLPALDGIDGTFFLNARGFCQVLFHHPVALVGLLCGSIVDGFFYKNG